MVTRDRPNIFTLEFWQHTITNGVYAFASGALGPLVANQANLIHSVPWYAALSSGGIGALIVILSSLATLRIPDRVPGSFLPETSEEERIERAIMREEAIARERIILREREQQEMDRHRAPEPERERPRPTDDFVVSGMPPPRRPDTEGGFLGPQEPEQKFVPPSILRPTPQPPVPQPISEPELPYQSRQSKSNIEGILGEPPVAEGRTDPFLQSKKPIEDLIERTKPVEPQKDSMEDWPQGGRRGKGRRK